MTKEEIEKKFISLACALSPENLTCDGECSRAEVNAKYRRIAKDWKALEKEYGKPVSEEEAWGFFKY